MLILITIVIVLLNFMGDYLLQMRVQERLKKSVRSPFDVLLFSHSFFYAAFMTFCLGFLLTSRMHWFFLITFLTHYLIDLGGKKIMRSCKEAHTRNAVIALEHVLHFLQVWITFYCHVVW